MILTDEEIMEIKNEWKSQGGYVDFISSQFARAIERAVLAKASQQVQGEPVQEETDIIDEYDGESLAASRVHWDEFEKWWDDHGQYIRAGGGNYERSFAWKAWNWAIFQHAKAMPTPKQEPVGDRAMLFQLMTAFDSEIHVCDACGHEEDTAHFDSAGFLRDYLRDNPAPAQAAAIPDDFVIVPEIPTYEMCKAGGFNWEGDCTEGSSFPEKYKSMIKAVRITNEDADK